MQLPPLQSSATVAATATAQATSKDRSTATEPVTPNVGTALATDGVAKSEQANADRDAQGGGDGLGHHPNRKKSEQNMRRESSAPVGDPELAANLPDPPGQLDLLG